MTTNMENQPALCVSCGAALTGQYCSQCGEEPFTHEKRTLRYFFGNTVVSELLSFDSKIWRTLRLLLFRPGFLTAEYALGRRRPYINSLRILIITIIIFAVTMTGRNTTFQFPVGDFRIQLNTIPSPMFSGSSIEGALYRNDPYGVIENMLEKKLGVPVDAIPLEVGTSFKDTLISLTTPLSFTVVLLLGMLLYLLYNRKRPLFVEHLVFAMNYYSFFLITAMIALLVSRIAAGQMSFAATLLLIFGFWLWRSAYLATAIRRFYFPNKRGLTAWPASVGVTFLLQIFNAIFITTIQLACGAVAVLLL